MAKMKKFQVKLEKLKLYGIGNENEAIAIEIKWKGPQKNSLLSSVPFYTKSPLQRNRTTPQRVLNKPQQTLEWDDEFHSICEFEFSPVDASIPLWDTKFYVLLEECTKSKTKSSVLGKASLNLAELLSEMETKIERNVPITLKDAAGPRQATLSVVVNFVEVREDPDPIQQEKEGFLRALKDLTNFKKKNREKVIWREGENRGVGDPLEEEGEQKQGKLLGKKRRLSFSFRHSKGKVEPWSEKTDTAVNDVVAVDRQLDDKESSAFPVAPISTSSQTEEAETTEFSLETDGQNKEGGTGGRWETREIVSRDGKAKLKTEVFFGSFDQRSEKAGGESACTAIVAVIAHWLHSNDSAMPTRPELDSLIMEGSSEWQKLCNNHCYSNSFPNKHFDLETVVEADIRPLTVLPENSFVGFFSPEKFNCLTDAMSFEQIWNEVNTKTSSHNEPRIYIVSWNDHFFVLKMEEDACYIIDSLGERLFEGCNQAYILKFDSSSLMVENEEKGEVGEFVCRGKECCREFFERFLAAITIEELEEEQRKLRSCNFTPHHRLQIDFHFSSPVASSSSTSPCSLFSD